MGRKYVGRKLTYRIPPENYLTFKEWCKERGLDVSMAIRGAISQLMRTGSISQLLEDEEMRNLAVELLENKKGE